MDSEAKNIYFFPSSSESVDFLPAVKQFLCFLLVHTGDSCLHLLLLARMIAKGSKSVYFHSWVAWKEFYQRVAAVFTSAVLSQCSLRDPICVSCKGSMKFVTCPDKNPGFPAQIKETLFDC